MKREIKEKVIELRKRGYTYSEILNDYSISKSTLTNWFKNLKLSEGIVKSIESKQRLNLKKARDKSISSRKIKRREFLSKLKEKNRPINNLLGDFWVKKIILGILYLGEGSKNRNRGSLVFGNSNSKVISLFLDLMREVYEIDENKWRCTIQCRADQNIKFLKNFWLSVTKIPSNQFYKTRIDTRTIGIKSRKKDYKGVCRLDYFSAEVFNDLLKVIEIVTEGH